MPAGRLGTWGIGESSTPLAQVQSHILLYGSSPSEQNFVHRRKLLKNGHTSHVFWAGVEAATFFALAARNALFYRLTHMNANVIHEARVRVRMFLKRGYPKRTLARRASLSINALRGADRLDWNPTAATLEACLRAIEEIEDEDQPVRRAPHRLAVA